MGSSVFVRRLGWSFLHQAVGRGAVFVFFALLPRWVSLEAAGVFVLAYTTMQVVLTPAFDTAIGTLLARSAAQGDRAGVRQLVRWALFLLVVLLTAGIAVVAVWQGLAPLWAWLAVYFALSLPLNMAFAICRGYGRFDVEGIVGSLQKASLLPLLAAMPGGEDAPARAMAFSAVAGWTLLAVVLWRHRLAVVEAGAAAPSTASGASTSLRETLFLTALATVALLYLRIDLVLLDAFSGARDVGLYATASRWIEATFILPFGFMLVLFPQLSSRPLHRGEMGQTMRMFALVGVVAFIGSLAAAWVVVPLVYDSAVGPLVAVLLVRLSPCALAVSVGMLFSQALVASGRTGLALVAALIGLVTNLAIAVVAIPRLGPAGAALAAVGTEVAVATAAGLLLRRVLNATPSAVMSPSATSTAAPDPS